MRIRTAITTRPEGRTALDDLAAGIAVPDGARPDFVALHFAEGLADAFGAQAAARLPAGALHGGTSCLGVMSDGGAAIAGGTGSGAFAIFDPAGSYGTGAAPLAPDPQAPDPQAAARAATLAALTAAGRPGESPALVWLTAAPGCEEAILEGVQQIVGRGTPIMGGSSADNAV
ncbi:MAG TPA: FIST N-terminal domain-containing protein, partial [Paracoccaceae bacterium]|nr:FIST N-terminal domain-containing protein [Paracoccaceae bacterium]